MKRTGKNAKDKARGGDHVNQDLTESPHVEAGDLRIFLDGRQVLRFFSNGDIQVPSDPEIRSAVAQQLTRAQAELEKYR